MNLEQKRASGLKAEEVKRRHILPKTLVVGLVAGLISSALREALHWLELHRIDWLHGHSPVAGLFGASIVGLKRGGLGSWLVGRFAPKPWKRIPQIKSVVLGKEQLHWRRVLPVKIVRLASIGGGMALGRVGPDIQIGGATGLMASTWFRARPGEGERKALISSGAGAGLAAAFNAPLAGVIFVPEELHGAFTPCRDSRCYAVSQIGAFSAHGRIRSKPRAGGSEFNRPFRASIHFQRKNIRPRVVTHRIEVHLALHQCGMVKLGTHDGSLIEHRAGEDVAPKGR